MTVRRALASAIDGRLCRHHTTRAGLMSYAHSNTAALRTLCDTRALSNLLTNLSSGGDDDNRTEQRFDQGIAQAVDFASVHLLLVSTSSESTPNSVCLGIWAASE